MEEKIIKLLQETSRGDHIINKTGIGYSPVRRRLLYINIKEPKGEVL